MDASPGSPPVSHTLLRQDLLTITQACLRAQVSRRAIYNWMRLGKIQWLYTAGGSRRIVAESLFRRPPGSRRPAPPLLEVR